MLNVQCTYRYILNVQCTYRYIVNNNTVNVNRVNTK